LAYGTRTIVMTAGRRTIWVSWSGETGHGALGDGRGLSGTI